MTAKPTQVDCQNCNVRYKSVFCNLTNDDLDEINMQKYCSSFKKGQIIFQKGTNPQGLLCINNGKVKLTISGEQGKEQIVRLASRGDVLGYRAMLSNDYYNATATALDATDVCFIPKETFFKLVDTNKGLARKFLSLLSTELKDVQQRLTDFVQKPVRERIAESLLLLKEIYGVEADGKTIDVSLSREDLANLAGTATETTIRTLSELNNAGIIELMKKKIKIINLQDLITEANMVD